MFNLEQSIAEWRRQMLTAGIKTPVPLEELESHLREDIELQIQSGTGEQRAFEIAVQRIGKASTLKCEFKKIERTLMKKVMLILVGIFGVLCGTAFILPAVAKYKEQGVLVHDAAIGLLLGIPIVLAGMIMAAVAFKRRKA